MIASASSRSLSLAAAVVWLAVGAGSAACTSALDGNFSASAGAMSGGTGGSSASAGASASGDSGAGSGSAGRAGSGAESGPEAFESVARRLSRTELDNVLADVLSEKGGIATSFLLEDEYAPYDNDYTLQTASQALIDGLNALAEDVARRALADAAVRATLVPCTPTGPGDVACFRRVIETTGAKLFRRPLTDAEINRYLTLQVFATEENPHVDNDFYTAVELFLQAALQDPEFLYRIEIGAPTAIPGVSRLDAYEVASRLSFLLAGTGPDAALFEQAQSGALLDTTARRAAAQRLLETERARVQIQRYHAMWLGYRAIPHPETLTRAFHLETTSLIDRVVFDDARSYLDLFTHPETYLDAALADHYGLPRPSAGSGWVTYASDSGRAGILSHGSVLSAFSKFSDTSPTQRGILVQTRLLCQEVAPPPANVNVDEPPGHGEAACKVERYAEHREIASCAACHAMLDPIGLGLEQYDVAGRFREHDDGNPECTLDGLGELPGVGPFSGPAELGQRLVESGRLDACSVRQYLAFAIGRSPKPDEQPRVDAALERFRANGHQFTELILDFVANPAFVLRREPAP